MAKRNYYIGRLPGRDYQVFTKLEISEREKTYREWITEPIRFQSKDTADKVCAMSNKTRID